MIYQKLLVGRDLYRVCSIDYSEFPTHSHYEIELIYCKRGFIDVICGNNNYRLESSEAILIDSMVPHSYKEARITFLCSLSLVRDFFARISST